MTYCKDVLQRKVVKEVNQGIPPMEVAKRYGIGKTQVYKLCKQRDVLECDKGVSVPNYSKITSMKSMYPIIDNLVYHWICTVRKTIGNRRPLPLSRAVIKARAAAEAKLRNRNDFCASDGWFYRFRWRYNILKIC